MSTYKLKILRCVGYNTAYKWKGEEVCTTMTGSKNILQGPNWMQ